MKYPCLILDHDDTVVQSSPDIHYPAFLETLSRVRPGMTPPSLAEFMDACSEPGFFPYCDNVLHYTPEDYAVEVEVWHRWVDTHIPRLYDGFYELLWDYTNAGGTICVVTHSESRYVLRDYAHHRLPTPALVFGAEQGKEHLKPSTWPLEEITRVLGFSAGDMLSVDDLMPGILMAKSCGAATAAAGWSHLSASVSDRLKASCGTYLAAVGDLRKLLL